MCLIFTCGETEFTSPHEGYPIGPYQCRNCGNYSANVVKHKPWFTLCFVPVVPLSIHGYEDVVCSICRFVQPLENRPDIINQARGTNEGGAIPMHPQHQGPPQGWGGGPPGGGMPPPKPQQQMQYR